MLKKLIKKIFIKTRLFKNIEKPPESGHRHFLLDLLPHNSIGVEIGVHLGKFSQEILDTISPKELHLVDPWEYQSSSIYKTAWYGGAALGKQAEMDKRFTFIHGKFKKNIDAKQIVIHRGYSEAILQNFPKQHFDWVYIDGNHLYEFVKKDLELSLLIVKPNGFITGDDYVDGGWWGGGVKKAVDEFMHNKQVKLIELRNRQFIFQKL